MAFETNLQVCLIGLRDQLSQLLYQLLVIFESEYSPDHLIRQSFYAFSNPVFSFSAKRFSSRVLSKTCVPMPRVSLYPLNMYPAFLEHLSLKTIFLLPWLYVANGFSLLPRDEPRAPSSQYFCQTPIPAYFTITQSSTLLKMIYDCVFNAVYL